MTTSSAGGHDLKEYPVDYKKGNILIEKTETNYESSLTRLMLINDILR